MTGIAIPSSIPTDTTATPNLVGVPHVIGDPDCWFYAGKNSTCEAKAPSVTADAFAVTAVGAIGNVRRNSLRGPHIYVFDAVLLREFPIREGWNVEARWEVFNLTNTPEFGQPNGNITSGGVASRTSLSGDPRVCSLPCEFPSDSALPLGQYLEKSFCIRDGASCAHPFRPCVLTAH